LIAAVVDKVKPAV